MTPDSRSTIQPRDQPSPAIPRRYWIAVVAVLSLVGLVIGATRTRSTDAILRDKVVGRWTAPKTYNLDFRRDGTCNVSFYGVVSLEGQWQVKDGYLDVRTTHPGNTFTDIVSSPTRWIDPESGNMKLRWRVDFLDNDHLNLFGDGVAERVKAVTP